LSRTTISERAVPLRSTRRPRAGVDAIELHDERADLFGRESIEPIDLRSCHQRFR
jgi:hypothetical protein